MQHRTLPSIIIRPFISEDTNECNDIMSVVPQLWSSQIMQQERMAVTAQQTGLVALKNGRIVGFVIIQPHFETAAEIVWMAVDPVYRRQGIGSALMERLQQELYCNGYKLLHALLLKTKMYADIQAFYQHVGFQQAESIHNPLVKTQQVILLVKPLTGK